MEVSFAAQIVDVLMTLLALFVSAVLILRFRFLGALLAIVSFYLLSVGRVELRYIMIPNWEGGITDAASLIGGIVLGVAWCSALLVGKLVYDWRRKVAYGKNT